MVPIFSCHRVHVASVCLNAGAIPPRIPGTLPGRSRRLGFPKHFGTRIHGFREPSAAKSPPGLLKGHRVCVQFIPKEEGWGGRRGAGRMRCGVQHGPLWSPACSRLPEFISFLRMKKSIRFPERLPSTCYMLTPGIPQGSPTATVTLLPAKVVSCVSG